MINATSEVADQAFRLMKKCVGYIIRKRGNQRANFQVIIHGDASSSSKKICFNGEFSDKAALLKSVGELERGTATVPALHNDLELACKVFKRENVTNDAEKARKVIIIKESSSYKRNESTGKGTQHVQAIITNTLGELKFLDIKFLAIEHGKMFLTVVLLVLLFFRPRN